MPIDVPRMAHIFPASARTAWAANEYEGASTLVHGGSRAVTIGDAAPPTSEILLPLRLAGVAAKDLGKTSSFTGDPLILMADVRRSRFGTSSLATWSWRPIRRPGRLGHARSST